MESFFNGKDFKTVMVKTLGTLESDGVLFSILKTLRQ